MVQGISSVLKSATPVARCDGDVEATIAVEESWVRAVQLDALLVDYEHGDLGAVFAGVEHLEEHTHDKDTDSCCVVLYSIFNGDF